MSEKDTVTKKYMSDNKVFADAFNFLLYDGEEVIKPEDLKPLDTTAIDVPFSRSGKTVSIQKVRDVFKLFAAMRDDKFVYLVLGAENQSDIHYAMPVKNMGYDFLEYSRQVSDIAKKHRENGDNLNGAEYLSGMNKTDRLIPVITLVIYFGADEWDAPLSIYDMLDVKDKRILKYVSNYRINLIAPNQLSVEEISKLRTNLKEVLLYIKFSNDKNKLKELIAKDEKFTQMERDAANVINICTNSKLRFNQKAKVVNMCRALQEWGYKERAEGRAEGREEGRAEGRAEGREEGRAEGREEGRAEGREEIRTELIMNAYKELKSIERVVKILGVSKENVEKVIGGM